MGLKLQCAGESRTFAGMKRPHDMLAGNDIQICGDSSSSHVPIVKHEAKPVCADAVALIHRALGNAKDAGRSELLLCGATPIYLQYRCRRRNRVSSAPHGESNERVSNVAAPNDYWTCGYRNVQILIGHLLQRKSSPLPQLFAGAVPDVESLQVELERLWRLGYDPEGCQQLGGVVRGTQKWIGTSEACVLLRGQSVRCNIVAFRGGDAVSAAAAVVEYAWRHFQGGIEAEGSSSSQYGIKVSSRPPLYLQHDGHSRTIVGIQRRYEQGGKRTEFLLVLDPGLGPQGFEDFASSVERGHGWERYVSGASRHYKKRQTMSFWLCSQIV